MLLAPPMAGQQIYDVLLKNGQVIDIRQNLEQHIKVRTTGDLGCDDSNLSSSG